MVYHHLNTVFIQTTRAASNSIHSLLATNLQLTVPLEHRSYTTIVHDQTLENNDISNYYSFSVVRNPYDRYVSAYTYLDNISSGYEQTFDQFLDLMTSFLPDFWNNTYSLFRPQWWYVCDSDQETILLDNICHYETLTADWTTTANTINTNNPSASISTTLPTLNASTGRVSWETYFTGSLGQERAEKIDTLYDKDFEIFNYDKLTF